MSTMTFRPADVAALGAPALLLCLAVAGGRHAGWIVPVLLWMLVVTGGLAIIYLRARVPGRLMHVVGTFWIALAIPAVYGTLNPVLDLLNPRFMDVFFMQNDLDLFGVHPTIWLEGRLPPFLVDVLIVCYASFYFWPLLLGVILYCGARQRDVDHLALLIVLGFFLNYVGYVLMPVVGPRWTLAPLYAQAPEGWLIGTELWRSFLSVPMVRDCVPSGHTAMTLLTLAFAFTRKRWFFWMMLPVAIPLIAATVLLRFHYVVDLVLAVPFAVLVWTLADAIHRRSAGLGEERLRADEKAVRPQATARA